MSQLYIDEKLVRIQPLVHKLLCRQESDANTNTFTSFENVKSPLLLTGEAKSFSLEWTLFNVYPFSLKREKNKKHFQNWR